MKSRTSRVRLSVGAVMAVLLTGAVAGLLATATPARATVFSNPGTITLPDPDCTDPDAAVPYPSNISVSGLSGTVTDVNVTLNGVSHPFEGDIEILLVGPAGGAQNLELLSDAGTGALSNATVTFDDSAAAQAPQNSAWGPGTYKPTNYTELSGPDTFPAPAPAPSANTTLAGAFNGIAPNGTWSLYVIDDACPDAGSIGGGWSLDITTAAAAAATTTSVMSSLNPSRTGQMVTFTATVMSGGSPVTTGTVTFTEGAATLAANVAVNGSGQASFSTSTLTEGNHIIQATYNGTASFATSSGTVDQRVDNNTTVTGNNYCNTGAVAIPVIGAATPYPSNIFVSGAPPSLTKVTATLKNVTHTFAGDIDALLVGPGSQNLVIVSDAGTAGVTNVTVTLDDAAGSMLPAAGSWGAPNSTISAKPTDYVELTADNFPAPAPAPSAATTLATFNGVNPNGTWSLYVVDDGAPDSGSIAGGWCITLTAAASPNLSTQASAGGPVGTQVTDAATLGLGNNPTGMMAFNLFGPNDATCASPAIFTSTKTVAGNGTYTSDPFTTPSPGTYRWTASYSGDANNASASSACNAANESVVITQATATVSTQATAAVTIGSAISDTATVTGAPSPTPAPTGTVTFTLFGPANATCTGAPVFTSPAQPLAGAPPPTAGSGPFTPTAPGTYRWVAAYSGDANYAAVTSACNAANESSVVNQAVATIATQATPTVTIGSPISDTATVTGGPAPAPTPTGTVTFTLFGPNNATCTGAAVFTSAAKPLAGGPPPTAGSGPFTPTSPGTYRWVAAYSGDANYPAVTSACNAANESSVVNQAVATIATQATPTVTIGSPISDTATVTGAPAPAPTPTGTVTFTLFGPNNATCTGAAVFTSAAKPLAGGPPPTAGSGPFTPTAPGTYRWVAAYSGDANYPAVTSACNAANESSVVNQAVATIATQATPTVTIGSPISDTATVTGAPAPAPTPTGTVTFTLFGPNNATCTGAPVFTSPAQPLAGGPPPTAGSGPFTPTAPGTYRWVAAYSGDANYPAVTSACNAANESSAVNKATPTVSTQASAGGVIGTSVNDTATVSGGFSPTGTVTFTLFGPNNATCTGAAVFNSGPKPLGGGPPPTAGSGSFTPSAPGTYRWVAAYSGDANNVAVTSGCNAANESSVVTQAQATISTQASAAITIGSPISDTATVTGAAAPAPTPTGTVTFTAFGPNDATCSSPAAFTSAPKPLAGGPPPTAGSGPFTPAVVGTYRWVAAYSGDANYPAVTSACNATNESSAVNKATPTISTQASAAITIGSPISDTATVTGAAAPAPTPTGTVTFTVFGPNDATCSSPAVFTSGPKPLAGGPPPTAGSGPFTPAVVGTYRWVAAYSGDAKNAAVTSACNAANESSAVNKASPTISTQASAGGVIGTSVNDVATVAGGASPTGTVTFKLFNSNACAVQVFTSTNPLGAGGTATSGSFTPAAVGTYYWAADYSGDAKNNAATSPCNAPNESVTISKASPTISTQASAGTPVGTAVNDVATVSGGSTPTGNVTFKLFNSNTCAVQVFTSTNPLVVNQATSGNFTPTAAGTYYWTAVYNGDAKNNTATSPCNAPNESVIVSKASPTISTTASPGVLEGGPVHDTATLAGGFNPTGNVIFRLFDSNTCANEVFTSTNPVGAGGTATSGTFTPAAVGTYYWTAVYGGDVNNNGATSPCNAPNESVVVRPFVPPPCTRTLTGDVTGPITVNAGESVCVNNARVIGPITVNPGGALTVNNSQVSNGIVANGPAFFSLCGSQVAAPTGNPAQGVVVTNAGVPVRIGDPAKGCAMNKVIGDVTLTGNTGGLTLGNNQVSGQVTVNNNTVGNVVIKANTIAGALGCAGNNPPPTNAGQPNTAAGGKTGQCAAL